MLEHQITVFRDLYKKQHSVTPEDVELWLDQLKNIALNYKPEPNSLIKWLSNLPKADSNHADDGQNDDSRPEIGEWPSFLHIISLSEAIGLIRQFFVTRRNSGTPFSGVRPEIVRALEFIHKHLDQELTLEQIAAQVRLSNSHFRHLFKKEVGFSVIDYLLEQRIELAKSYLESGKYRNYELADKVGVPNYSYFCTLFKKHTGMSPNEYKVYVRGSKVQ